MGEGLKNAFRRGDENRPKPHGLASTPMNGKISPPTQTPKSPARLQSIQRAGDFWGFCVGGIFSIQPGTCETGRVRAIFIAPTKLRSFYIPPFIEVHSLSLAFARQLPQGGSRGGAVPFNVPLGSRGGGGRFSSPLRKAQESFPFTVHWGGRISGVVPCRAYR